MAYQALDVTPPGDSGQVGGAKINANFVEVYRGIPLRKAVPSAGSPLNLDFENCTEKIFVADTPLTGSKVAAFANASIAEQFAYCFEVSGSGLALELPNVGFISSDSRFNSTTRILTLTGAGKYEIIALSDGINWRLKAEADGGAV